MSFQKTVLIFEPDASGHHPGYLYHLLIHFLNEKYDFRLAVLVNPDFFEKHPAIIQNTSAENIEWLSTSETTYNDWKNSKSDVIKRAKLEWTICAEYAKNLQAIHILMMYFDHLQLACLTEQKPICPISGILFRPTLVNYPVNSVKEKISFWRKYLLLKAILHRKALSTLFCLDPFAVDFIQQNWRSDKVKFLPDPVQVYPNKKSIRLIKEELGITESKKVFLIFGHLDDRKGISTVMDTFAKLSDGKAKDVCLLIVGPWDAQEKSLFEQKLAVLQQKNSVQVITRNHFVADEDIQSFFEVSDYILALYQKHIGMSAIMVRAASAQKPLITFNYGLMGKITAEKQLGLLIDEAIEDDFQHKLEALLNSNSQIGNQKSMKEFADLNQAKNYAKVILDSF
ncbi:glycosyltransferase [Arcicella lustrica]|uniref:Glycosyltransferase n=1 Tax=Arcicella lustrica TaxID=2984196 RepID=A0ABU5SML7_9BACT|nr:glycosyltransferase [Arcicella sp. DC25W]MEA5428554.1 glycosyltransferase [Arcicella sp. DC25W]